MTDAAISSRASLGGAPAEPAPVDVAARRRARRQRAETRFRLYGLAAIGATGAFLCAILGDVAIKAWPAFTQSEIVLDVPVTSEFVDAKAAKSGDYDSLMRDALRAQFPSVKSRGDRKALDSLLSSSAPDALRIKVAADPSLVGKTVAARGLLSSDADLFVKGISTATSRYPGQGVATPTLTDSGATVSLEPGALAAILKRISTAQGKPPVFDTSTPSLLIALAGGVVKANTVAGDRIEGEILVPFSEEVPSAAQPGAWQAIVFETPEGSRKITDKPAAFLSLLQDKGKVARVPNLTFLNEGDSREPEQAGILGALAGSALTMMVTLGLCLPVGVGAAIYLEEFAPKNKFTQLIEVNINNLAAVPSIVFGLLGLAIFLNFGGLPRSSALVGGLVLALLVLPTIIIASRAALKSVPPSITDAALALGATHQQAVFHHVLPLAIPGIMTGTIIGMAHALGETAPLLMIGMVAFVADIPKSLTEAATVLPVQIFLWSDLPEAGFEARTAAAIVILLLFLVAMNGFAILIRKKFERRW